MKRRLPHIPLPWKSERERYIFLSGSATALLIYALLQGRWLIAGSLVLLAAAYLCIVRLLR